MKMLYKALAVLAIGVASISTVQARDSFSFGINIGTPYYYAPPPVYYSAPPVVYYGAPTVYYRPAPPVVYSPYAAYGYYGGHRHHGWNHHSWRGEHRGWGRGDRGHHRGWDR